MTSRIALLVGSAALAVTLSACDSGGGGATASQPSQPGPLANAVAAAPPLAPAAPTGDPAVSARVEAINKALFHAPGTAPTPLPLDTPAVAAANTTSNTTEVATANTTSTSGKSAKPSTPPDGFLVKAEVLLARANFSPGVIDGTPGTNLKHAVMAYAAANGIDSGGDITEGVWAKLNAGSTTPVAASYTLTAQDVSGPWSAETHDDITKMKGMDKIGFTSAVEALAERFHMSQDLLRGLNPGVDFALAGQVITVADVGQLQLPKVDHVDVDKSAEMVRAYDEGGKILAAFPATIGSTEKPSPTGVHKVQGVARDPTYTYDPKKLTWGPRKLGKFTVAAGPNNPVGAVWIDLDAPSYGMHGTPEPEKIGKTQSHGCVRMTNWDALLLASGVKPGVKVTFVKGAA